MPSLSYSALVLADFELLRSAISSYTIISEVITYLKAIGHEYPRMSLVHNFLITLPVSVAPDRRSFSKTKIVKDYL